MCIRDSAEVEPVIAAIQRFDPVGVAARSAQECLLIQIEMLRYDRDPILVDLDRKSTRLNSSHIQKSRMPSSA